MAGRLVIAIRVVVPLTILRWPLAGGVLALVEQLHPWQWLRETIIEPLLGGSPGPAP